MTPASDDASETSKPAGGGHADTPGGPVRGARNERSAVRTLAISVSATVIGVLPMFLVGALAVEMTRDLGFGATGLGIAVAAFRVGAAAASGPLGRLTDNRGATASMRLGAVIAATTSLAIAFAVFNLYTLVAVLTIAGTAQALCQPAANRLLTNRIPLRRQGIAFGIKQSAPPVASMIAGMSVPLLAVTVGWRWAFVVVPVLAVVSLGGVRRPATASAPARAPRTRTEPTTMSVRSMWPVMVTFGAASAAATSVPAFFVDASVTAGMDVVTAGYLLAFASIFVIVVRLSVGMLADRIVAGHLRICAALLASGVVGLVLLATGSPVGSAVGVFIALGGAWGFNGVFWYAMMRAFPGSPGTVTGVVFPGGLIGGVVGPVTFGIVAEQAGYPVAWIFGAVLSLVAAAGMLWTSRKLGARANAARSGS